jgi:hypothetical protein
MWLFGAKKVHDRAGIDNLRMITWMESDAVAPSAADEVPHRPSRHRESKLLA